MVIKFLKKKKKSKTNDQGQNKIKHLSAHFYNYLYFTGSFFLTLVAYVNKYEIADTQYFFNFLGG